MMFNLYIVIIVLYVVLDFNYFLRTIFSVISGRLYQGIYSLNDVSSIYGICTFLDCDVEFRNMREARIIRELDFARYHYYDRTGIYTRSRELKIHSLQGCTLTLCNTPIPLFMLYKIITKLVYWDERSLFFEHQVITVGDNKVRYYLISRQHAIGENGDSTSALLEGLSGSEIKPKCPENIKHWLKSLEGSSKKLRNIKQ